MKLAVALMAAALGLAAVPASAAEISTHILDLARGTGGAGVAVTLLKRGPSGEWATVGSARTDANGRVRRFDRAPADTIGFAPGDYRLQFDMSGYPDATAAPFFPEITVTFRVGDAAGHYHVPVVVSPYGYSTYRGN